MINGRFRDACRRLDIVTQRRAFNIKAQFLCNAGKFLKRFFLKRLIALVTAVFFTFKQRSRPARHGFQCVGFHPAFDNNLKRRSFCGPHAHKGTLGIHLNDLTITVKNTYLKIKAFEHKNPKSQNLFKPAFRGGMDIISDASLKFGRLQFRLFGFSLFLTTQCSANSRLRFDALPIFNREFLAHLLQKNLREPVRGRFGHQAVKSKRHAGQIVLGHLLSQGFKHLP